MSRANELNIACIQLTAIDGQKQETVEKCLSLIDKAAADGAQMVVLPEVWTGLGYSSADLYKEIAEPIPGPVTDKLSAKAKKHGLYIVGSFYENAGGGVYYNSAPMIEPSGKIIGVYRKTHLFDAPQREDIKGGIRESDKVKAGDTLPVLETEFGPVGLSVCSDLRFPEIYRTLTLKGARIIVCASAFLSPRLDHWEFFLRARAAENQLFVVASGQYGTEPESGISFVGRSMVVDPWGVISATAPDMECATTTRVDLSYIDEVRRRYPLLEQRCPEMYEGISDVELQDQLHRLAG
jgi:predicted amidohydrolase